MLKESNAFSGFAVPDIEAAKRFYGETLGVDVADGPMDILELRVGDGPPVMVYPKEDHAPANYTILNFPVDDIEAAVEGLSERGVEFERYEGFEQDEKGISRNSREGGPDIAWFKDPAGNILSVLTEAS